QLDRKASGLQHATLYVFRAFAQMRVAEIDVTPGIDDPDDRLAGPIGGIKTALAEPRAMSEGAQVADAEPAMAAQLLRAFACGHSRRYASPSRSKDWLRGPLFPISPFRRQRACQNRPPSPGWVCRQAP